jgi:hypothetical protein
MSGQALIYMNVEHHEPIVRYHEWGTKSWVYNRSLGFLLFLGILSGPLLHLFL